MSGASSAHRHWVDPSAYDFGRTYVVNFLKRPLGMLVEDRGGVCTVVELQCDDDGRIGQAAAHGVMVDDAIVSLQGLDTRHLEFAKLTEHIRQAKMPFQIGFVRHVRNLRTATPPYVHMSRYVPMPPSHHHHSLPLMGIRPPAHDWNGKPPHASNLVRPRPVLAQAGKGPSILLPGPSKPQPTSMAKQGANSNRYPPPQQPPPLVGVGSGKRGVKRTGPDEETKGGTAYPTMRQLKQQRAMLSASMAAVQANNEQKEVPNLGSLEVMMEALGKQAVEAFLSQPYEEDGEEETGRGGKEEKGAKEKDEGPLNQATVGRINKRFVEVREALLRNRQASHDLYEYSRALLCRGDVAERVEGRVAELLQHRALDVRDKVQELRAGEAAVHRAVGSMGNELSVRWNEVNEQRRQQLQYKRQVLDQTSAELGRMVTETIPTVCRSVEAELQTRMEGLQRLLTGLQDVVAPSPERGKKARREEGGGKAEAASGGANASRPHLLDYHHHDRPDTPNTVGTHHGPYEHKPPKIGSECQVADGGIPSQWAPDASLTVLTTHLPFPKDGEDMCRWKPPPPEPHMPGDEEIDELVSNFRPELKEVVFWELYRRGWDVPSTLEGLKHQLRHGSLNKETSVEPLSKQEAAVFEKAMAESWKNFGKAVEMLKSAKSHRSVVVHYYNQFKRSEAYRRLKPKGALGGYGNR